MTWTPLPLGENPATGIVATLTKKKDLAITFGSGPTRALHWEEDDPNITLSLGDGEHAGWLRITLDDDGITPQPATNGFALLIPRSVIPELAPIKTVPLTWRSPEPGIVEVRLPVATTAVGRPRPALVRGKTPEDDSVEKIMAIGTPALYAELVREAAARGGLDIIFLSDGNCAVGAGGSNMKMMSVDDMEAAARRAIERGAPDPRAASAA